MTMSELKSKNQLKHTEMNNDDEMNELWRWFQNFHRNIDFSCWHRCKLMLLQLFRKHLSRILASAQRFHKAKCHPHIRPKASTQLTPTSLQKRYVPGNNAQLTHCSCVCVCVWIVMNCDGKKWKMKNDALTLRTEINNISEYLNRTQSRLTFVFSAFSVSVVTFHLKLLKLHDFALFASHNGFSVEFCLHFLSASAFFLIIFRG